MQQAAAITGLVNIAAAAILLALVLRGFLSRRRTAIAALTLAVVATLLGVLLATVDNVTEWSRARLYPDPVSAHTQSAYPESVVTKATSKGRTDRRLYLEGARPSA